MQTSKVIPCIGETNIIQYKHIDTQNCSNSTLTLKNYVIWFYGAYLNILYAMEITVLHTNIKSDTSH